MKPPAQIHMRVRESAMAARKDSAAGEEMQFTDRLLVVQRFFLAMLEPEWTEIDDDDKDEEGLTMNSPPPPPPPSNFFGSWDCEEILRKRKTWEPSQAPLAIFAFCETNTIVRLRVTSLQPRKAMMAPGGCQKRGASAAAAAAAAAAAGGIPLGAQILAVLPIPLYRDFSTVSTFCTAKVPRGGAAVVVNYMITFARSHALPRIYVARDFRAVSPILSKPLDATTTTNPPGDQNECREESEVHFSVRSLEECASLFDMTFPG